MKQGALGLHPSPEFGTVVMDPAWPERGGGECKRGADRHYGLQSVPEILADLSRLRGSVLRFGPAAHLYVWVTNTYLRSGFDIIDLLGFRYIHPITWAKTRYGLGQYRRGQTEHCLFAVRGDFHENDTAGRLTTLLGGELLAPQGHSVKPPQLMEDAERNSPGPRLEMNCRAPRAGWWSYGTLDGARTTPYLLSPSGDEIRQ